MSSRGQGNGKAFIFVCEPSFKSQNEEMCVLLYSLRLFNFAEKLDLQAHLPFGQGSKHIECNRYPILYFSV